MPELKKPIVAFDVDGVLRDLVQYTLDNEKVLDELTPENRKRPSEITSYGDFVDLFESKDQWKRLLNDTDAWIYAPANNPMLNVWFKLREQGYNCIIVTSNSHVKGQTQTVDWLHRYLDPKGNGIDIHFVNDKSTVKYDVLIEDMPMNAAKASEDGRLAFLVKRPWTDLDKQKADSKDRLVTKWNPMLFVQLPDDHEALPVIERKLAWFEGYREAAAVILKAKFTE